VTIDDNGEDPAVLMVTLQATWHIAFVMPGDTIDQILAEAVDLLPQADPPSVSADQTKLF